MLSDDSWRGRHKGAAGQNMAALPRPQGLVTRGLGRCPHRTPGPTGSWSFAQLQGSASHSPRDQLPTSPRPTDVLGGKALCAQITLFNGRGDEVSQNSKAPRERGSCLRTSGAQGQCSCAHTSSLRMAPTPPWPVPSSQAQPHLSSGPGPPRHSPVPPTPLMACCLLHKRTRCHPPVAKLPVRNSS